MQQKDYYHILGVSDSASPQEIKRAYRELAKKFHPETNSGNVEAERKFKEISEAYDILKSSEKRRKYDQLKKYGYVAGQNDWFASHHRSGYGQQAGWPFERSEFSSNGHFSFGDILKEIFGIDHAQKASMHRNGQTTRPKIHTAEISINFNESLAGTEKYLQISTNKKCDFCKGAGYQSGRDCPVCQTSGKIRDFKKIKIKIPAGVEDGHKLKLSRIPIETSQNGMASDLIVSIRVKPHKFFSRQGNDIFCEVPLEDAQLQKGARIRVSTITGKKIDLYIKPGTEKGTTIRLARMGITANGVEGDQYIKVV